MLELSSRNSGKPAPIDSWIVQTPGALRNEVMFWRPICRLAKRALKLTEN